MCGRRELAWADSAPAMCMMLPLLLGCAKKVRILPRTAPSTTHRPPPPPLPPAVHLWQVNCYAFHLDAEKVAAAKVAGAEKGGVPYVTTNDILTSGFFNACGTRIGFMGIDCRDKMKGIEKVSDRWVTVE